MSLQTVVNLAVRKRLAPLTQSNKAVLYVTNLPSGAAIAESSWPSNGTGGRRLRWLCCTFVQAKTMPNTKDENSRRAHVCGGDTIQWCSTPPFSNWRVAVRLAYHGTNLQRCPALIHHGGPSLDPNAAARHVLPRVSKQWIGSRALPVALAVR